MSTSWSIFNPPTRDLTPNIIHVADTSYNGLFYVFPASEFQTITDTLRQAPVTAKAARDYQRVMFAGAHDEIPDRQGRVTIPQGLREYASLEKDCVVIGANTRVEIWDAASWKKYLQQSEKGFADVSEEVFPGLF